MLLKNAARAAAGLAVAAAAAVVIAPGAHAVSRVNCAGRTDFFTIWNYNYSGELCFANNGSTNVAIYDVNEVDTGNNSGYYDIGGGQAYQASYVDVGYSGNPEITWIDIVGR
jgi:hypothetical protein